MQHVDGGGDQERLFADMRASRVHAIAVHHAHVRYGRVFEIRAVELVFVLERNVERVFEHPPTP